MPKSVFTRRYGAFRLALIAARRSRNLTQAALARKLGRPQSFVSKYERGERRLDVVEFLAIAKALGVDPSKFLKQLDEGK